MYVMLTTLILLGGVAWVGGIPVLALVSPTGALGVLFIGTGVASVITGPRALWMAISGGLSGSVPEETVEPTRDGLRVLENALLASGGLLAVMGILKMLFTLDTPQLIGPSFASSISASLVCVVLARLILYPLRVRLISTRDEGMSSLVKAPYVHLLLLLFAVVNFGALFILLMVWKNIGG